MALSPIDMDNVFSSASSPRISLVEEVREMMQLALMIYGTTDMRQVARKQRERQRHQQQLKKQPFKQTSTWLPDLPTPSRDDNDVGFVLRDELIDSILSMPFSFALLERILGELMSDLQNTDRSLVEVFLNAMPTIQSHLEDRGLYSHHQCKHSKQDVNEDHDQSGIILFDVDAGDGEYGVVQDQYSHEVERDIAISNDKTSEQSTPYESCEQWPLGVVVTSFGDERSEEELVYAMGYNSDRKRITICFRGSVTTNDWLTDADMRMVAFPNPVESDGFQYEKTPFVSIHKGFHDYLFGGTSEPINTTSSPGSAQLGEQPRSPSDDMNKNDTIPVSYTTANKRRKTGRTKYDQIVDNLMELLERFPDYKIYVTGHSLGGSLSTLFGFALASNPDPRIPKPIKCITFASPRVGNITFRRAFQALERRSQLQHLRVANENDIVTMTPDGGSASILCIGLMPENLYRGVGLKLKLCKNDVKFTYPYPHKDYLGQVRSDILKLYNRSRKVVIDCLCPCHLCCKENPVVNHGCQEYLDRLDANTAELSEPTIDKLYEDMVYNGRRRRGSLQMVRQSIVGRLSIFKSLNSFSE